MFARIRCRRCHLSSLWTDDPEHFLRSICTRPGSCTAKLVEEAGRGAKTARPVTNRSAPRMVAMNARIPVRDGPARLTTG